jgi:rhodanese-related sulfurtransferase
VAEEYRDRGFTNVEVIQGGVEAWKQAGYDLAPATA